MPRSLRLIVIFFGFIFFIFAVRLVQLPFFYDDNELWMINATQADLVGILSAFIPTQGDVLLPHAFYRPITHFTWWLDGAIWGQWIVGYRVTNLLLYAANAFACYQIALRLGDRTKIPAILASLVFLLHPVHMEVLAWTACRGDLLALLFMAIGFNFHICISKFNINKICVLFVLALLSKETALVFPLWIIAYDIFLSKEPRYSKTQWLTWIALTSVTAGYLVFRLAFFGGLGGYNSTGHSLHLELLQQPLHILSDRLIENPLKALLLPWPGLAEHADRYEIFRHGLSITMVAVFLFSAFKLPWRQTLAVAFCFLAIALGSYLPGSVVRASSYLENGRMLFASSLSAALLIGFAIHQCTKLTVMPYKNIASAAVLACFSFSFALSIQPWEHSATTLRELPRAVRHTFNNLKPHQELLIVNEDLAFYKGALCLSTTPSAVTRAMHLEFGKKPPQVDWKHAKSAHKFTALYWDHHKIGEDLFFAEWQPESRSLIDLTAGFKDWHQKTQNQPLEPIVIWDGDQILEHQVDAANLDQQLMAEGNLLLNLIKPDSWLAMKTPAIMPRRVRLTWSTNHPEDMPLKLGLFWVTNMQPNWSSRQSLCLNLPAKSTMISEIPIPYHHDELTNPETILKAIRIDPGGLTGKVELHQIEFLQ